MELQLSNVSKALEPYSRAFLITQIWGEVATCELAKYRKKLFDRFKKSNWTRLEIEKITAFLKYQKVVIDEFLNCV
jgi:hypothetical protein